jgi:hypothetical protein
MGGRGQQHPAGNPASTTLPGRCVQAHEAISTLHGSDSAEDVTLPQEWVALDGVVTLGEEDGSLTLPLDRQEAVGEELITQVKSDELARLQSSRIPLDMDQITRA